MWPHRRQPTSLPHPWDYPGKNTGGGCHFLLQCRKVKSESEVTQLCPTLSYPVDYSLPGSSVHGIFQARVLEWGAITFSVSCLHFSLILSPLAWIHLYNSGFCPWPLSLPSQAQKVSFLNLHWEHHLNRQYTSSGEHFLTASSRVKGLRLCASFLSLTFS